MVKWYATLDTGEKISGEVDKSWLELKDSLGDRKIASLELSNGSRKALIDPNCDGYYLGWKAIACLNTGKNERYLGIGYYKKDDGLVRIKWYKPTLNLWTNEVKTVEGAGVMLIRNPNGQN